MGNSRQIERQIEALRKTKLKAPNPFDVNMKIAKLERRLKLVKEYEK